MELTSVYIPKLEHIRAASSKLEDVASLTPLNKKFQYSNKFDCNVYFKREDLQVVRSYKIRGAYNRRVCLHFPCLVSFLKFMALYICTPNQKIEQVKMFGIVCTFATMCRKSCIHLMMKRLLKVRVLKFLTLSCKLLTRIHGTIYMPSRNLLMVLLKKLVTKPLFT